MTHFRSNNPKEVSISDEFLESKAIIGKDLVTDEYLHRKLPKYNLLISEVLLLLAFFYLDSLLTTHLLFSKVFIQVYLAYR